VGEAQSTLAMHRNFMLIMGELSEKNFEIRPTKSSITLNFMKIAFI
jgi:hypothetical protein